MHVCLPLTCVLPCMDEKAMYRSGCKWDLCYCRCRLILQKHTYQTQMQNNSRADIHTCSHHIQYTVQCRSSLTHRHYAARTHTYIQQLCIDTQRYKYLIIYTHTVTHTCTLKLVLYIHKHSLSSLVFMKNTATNSRICSYTEQQMFNESTKRWRVLCVKP